MESSCDISLSGTCAEDKFISGVYEDVRHVQLGLIIARVMHCGGGTQPSEYCNMINRDGWQRRGLDGRLASAQYMRLSYSAVTLSNGSRSYNICRTETDGLRM